MVSDWLSNLTKMPSTTWNKFLSKRASIILKLLQLSDCGLYLLRRPCFLRYIIVGNKGVCRFIVQSIIMALISDWLSSLTKMSSTRCNKFLSRRASIILKFVPQNIGKTVALPVMAALLSPIHHCRQQRSLSLYRSVHHYGATC